MSSRMFDSSKPSGKRLATRPTVRVSSASSSSSSSSSQGTGNANESNIKVYVRCRSRNPREINENSGVVVSTRGARGKEVIIQSAYNSSLSKTYTFDRVFGAESDQEEVFDGIAKNVLNEVLSGYNCTIFAYGQTGTGKTYTMSGDISSNASSSRTFLNENAGIIPRTLNGLFKHLEKIDDYSVKVSFIELYNEELKDLLSTNTTTNDKSLKIFDEAPSNNNGSSHNNSSSQKKSVMIQNMEEVYIKSPMEGLKLLQMGSHKRQVASTKCNDLSSRSHTVFTVTVHMKYVENNEEFVKVGKLNLVDLAGSENIDRSGATNIRAKEAGMINQSLLTLGRVINSLVENSSHIPYRESKLTRLLQDSLGGQTKTCIIATISPAKISVDETLSTLEYAHRAKSIKNKPQVNQSLNKKQLITDCIEEIERLKRDLNATRNKNGIYLTTENYNLLVEESESRRIRIDELQQMSSGQTDKLKKIKTRYEELEKENCENQIVIANLNKQISLAKQRLDETENKLIETGHELQLNKTIVGQQEITESKLQDLVKTYQDKLELSVSQSSRFHNLLNTKDLKVDDQLKIIDTTFDKFVHSVDMEQSSGLDRLSSEFEKNVKSVFNDLFDNYSSAQHTKLDSLSDAVSKKLSIAIGDLQLLNDSMSKDSEVFNHSFKSSTDQFVTDLKDINDSSLKELIKTNEIQRLEVLNRLNEINTNLIQFTQNEKSNVLLMKNLMESKVNGITNELGRLLKDGFEAMKNRELQTKMVKQSFNKKLDEVSLKRNEQSKELLQNICDLLNGFNSEQENEYTKLASTINEEMDHYDKGCVDLEQNWMTGFERYVDGGLSTAGDEELQREYTSIQSSVIQDSEKIKSQMNEFQSKMETSTIEDSKSLESLLDKLNSNVEVFSQFSNDIQGVLSDKAKMTSVEITSVIDYLEGQGRTNGSEIKDLSQQLSAQLRTVLGEGSMGLNNKVKQLVTNNQQALDSFKSKVLASGQRELIESSKSIKGDNTSLQALTDHRLRDVSIPITDKLSIVQNFNRFKQQANEDCAARERKRKFEIEQQNVGDVTFTHEDDKENNDDTQITPVPDKPMIMLDKINGGLKKRLKFGNGSNNNVLKPVNR